MSSLSGVSTSAVDQSTLYALLQKIKQTTAANKTSQSASADAPEGPQEFLTGELEKQGYSGSTLSDLLAKIQSTVDALQNSGTGQVDPAKIHDAINKVLKEAGVNTDQIDKDFQAQHPHGPGGGPPPMDSASSSENSTSSTDTLLSALGIDPKQFQAALQNALLNVSSDGSIDLSGLFASAGTGSQINVLA